MKKIVFLSLFVILIIGSCTQQQVAKSPLDGAWDVISVRQMHGDTVSDYVGSTLKIWSGNYYNFVGRWSLNGDTMNSFGWGTFKLEGDRYEENLVFPAPNTIKMLLEIKNDTITQTWPVDDNGVVDKSNYYVEKFVRMK
jgi:hypothetical protein